MKNARKAGKPRDPSTIHQLTPEDRRKGGLHRVYDSKGNYRDDFIEMCEYGYFCLQIMKPGVAMFIYRQKIIPHMQRKAAQQQRMGDHM